ncbi:MAG: prepilin-type N-terminal cleavage/methylation domain-containing protein [Pseudomonadota bacterium]
MFKRRLSRRRKGSRGFTLIEALVALTVSAMTLGLLASAGFGLQQARQTQAHVDAPLDRIIARRVLQEWIGAATKSHPDTEGAFEGEADRLALRTAQGQVMRLEIVTENQISTLTAIRAGRMRDVRMISETTRGAELLRVPGLMRFSYLMPTGVRGQLRDWTPVVRQEDGRMPIAVALDLGETRIAIAPIASTAAAPCMVAFGMSENGVVECELR